MSDKYNLQTLSGSISIGKGDRGETGERGPIGPKGDIGDNNVCVGTSPTDEAEIWFDTSSDEGGEAVATLKELQKVDQRVSEIISSNGGGVKDNEIIDAREGEICLGDKIRKISSSLDTVDNNINELDVKIAENKSLTDSEIEKLKEIANTWESFKNTGGVINGDVDFSTGLNARRVSLKNDQNDFFSFIALNDTTIGIKFNDSILQTLDRFGEFYIGGYSKEPNGFTKLPNGMIMQWGEVQFSDIGHNGIQSFTNSINFPIEFPNAMFVSVVTPHTNHYDSGKIKTCVVRYDMSGKSVLAVCINVDSPGPWHTKVKYIAIGY